MNFSIRPRLSFRMRAWSGIRREPGDGLFRKIPQRYRQPFLFPVTGGKQEQGKFVADLGRILIGCEKGGNDFFSDPLQLAWFGRSPEMETTHELKGLIASR